MKEGLLLKQTSSFQRWKKRYFKLRGRTLYYAKDAKVSLAPHRTSVRLYPDPDSALSLHCKKLQPLITALKTVNPYHFLIVFSSRRRKSSCQKHFHDDDNIFYSVQ